jgi:hypothetical protein
MADKAKKKAKERRLPVKRMPSDLRVGDYIVISLNTDATVKTATAIRHIVRGQSCRHYHINDTHCYKSWIPVAISLPESDVERGISNALLEEAVEEMITA